MAKDKTLSYALIAAGVGLGIYAATSGSNETSSNTGSGTQVPNGAAINTPWGQWQNTTGAPVWVTATGLVINSANSVLGNVTSLIQALNNGSGNNSNSGGGGGAGAVTTGQGITGGIGAGIPGRYYNPQPGGLM